MHNPPSPNPRLLAWLWEQLPRITSDLQQKALRFDQLKGSGKWKEIRDLAEQLHRTKQLQTDLTDYLSLCSQQEPSDLTPETSYVPADEMRPFVLQVLSSHGRQTQAQVEARVFQLMQDFLVGGDLQMVTEHPPLRRWQLHYKRAVKAMRDAGLVSGRGHQSLDLTPAGLAVLEVNNALSRPPMRRKLASQALRDHIPVSGYREIILQILAETQSMTSRQIMLEVGKRLENKFSAADLEYLTSGKPRWYERAYAALNLVLEQGRAVYQSENRSWTVQNLEGDLELNFESRSKLV